MNKTQKIAIGVIALNLLLGSILAAFSFFDLKSIHDQKTNFIVILSLFLLVSLFSAWLLFFLKKRQSNLEPDEDERDRIIKLKAVKATLKAMLILLVAANIIANEYFGVQECIKIKTMQIMTYLIILSAITVGAVSVLIQYGRGSNYGE
jgi:hypothetical protein